MTINLATADTLFYIDSLLPKQNYKFTVTATTNNLQLTTNEVLATTLDTTSHNFTWQTFTFGEHSSSVLYDVAVINENNIWAVGEIYMNDSLGQPDPIAYNAVHWDGSEWELKRIEFYTFCPQGTGSGYYPTRSVFAFDNENIVISSGSQLAYLRNGVQVKRECVPVSVNKIWGVSLNDFYVVGYGGGIAHWDGVKWSKIESPIGTGGTKLNIGDIWGIKNMSEGYTKYLAAGDAMLKVNQQNEIEDVKLDPGMFVNLLWGTHNNLIYTAGNGVVLYKNNKWEKIDRPDINTAYGIRGSNYNNIFGISSTLSILHFNGYSWQFINIEAVNVYYRLDVKNNLAVTVGWQGDKAALTLLSKN